MELIAVLNSGGNPTGEVKERDAIHKDGDWHKTVHVWIINPKNQLLLQRRHPQKYSHPCKWDISSAGHIKAGQSSIEAALSEVDEELGLRFCPEELELLFSVSQTDVMLHGYVDNEINDVYLIHSDVDKAQMVMQADEVVQLKWLSLARLEKLVNAGDTNYVPHDAEYSLLFRVLHARLNRKQ